MSILDVVIVIAVALLSGALHGILVHGGYIDRFCDWLNKERMK